MNHTTTPPRHRLLRFAVVGALVLAAPLALTACSGSSGSPVEESSASGGLGTKWGSCMRDAGFDVEDPTDETVSTGAVITPPGVDQVRFAQAAQTCGRQIGVGGASSAEKDKWKRQYAAVDSCIRETYPDAPAQEPGSLDYGDLSQDPAFQQAWDDCMAKHAPDTQSVQQ